MDHKARYQALVEFLLPYQEIWRNEIMLQYPHSLEGYNPLWIEELKGHTAPHKTWPLIQNVGWNQLKAPGLAAFHAKLQELTQFPALESLRPMKTVRLSWIHIIPKKRHELERLAPLVASLLEGKEQLVDIGGGQGHLAQTVAHHYGAKVLSLDMDPELQATGKHWQEVKWETSPHQVEFKLHKVERRDKVFAGLMNEHTVTTGLHTCGPLAVAHLEAAVLARATVLNMPCCYHKQGLEDCNLSTVAQGLPLDFNQYALTLASGAHFRVSEADIVFRNQIKLYRYTLHFLLHHEFEVKEQVKLGPCAPEFYHGPFPRYVHEQLKRLGLESNWSDERLQAYLERPAQQELIQGMLAAAILRDALGRALEAAIICDRAIWMEEQGYAVELIEVFDPHISPRSLGLVARRIQV